MPAFRGGLHAWWIWGYKNCLLHPNTEGTLVPEFFMGSVCIAASWVLSDPVSASLFQRCKSSKHSLSNYFEYQFSCFGLALEGLKLQQLLCAPNRIFRYICFSILKIHQFFYNSLCFLICLLIYFFDGSEVCIILLLLQMKPRRSLQLVH